MFLSAREEECAMLSRCSLSTKEGWLCYQGLGRMLKQERERAGGEDRNPYPAELRIKQLSLQSIIYRIYTKHVTASASTHVFLYPDTLCVYFKKLIPSYELYVHIKVYIKYDVTRRPM